MNAVPPYEPPQAPLQVGPGKPIPNYMVWSIIATVACVIVCCSCWSVLGIITGIIAIVFASKVNSAQARGDIAAALNASNIAKILTWVTTAIFVLTAALLVFRIVQAGGVDAFMDAFKNAYEQAKARQGG